MSYYPLSELVMYDVENGILADGDEILELRSMRINAKVYGDEITFSNGLSFDVKARRGDFVFMERKAFELLQQN